MEVGEANCFVALVAIDFCLFLGLKTDLAHWDSDEHLILVLFLVVLLLIAWGVVFLIYFRLKVERNIAAICVYVSFAVS